MPRVAESVWSRKTPAEAAEDLVFESQLRSLVAAWWHVRPSTSFSHVFCFVLFFICGLAIILLFRFKISETMRKNNTCHVPHTQYVPNATGGPWYPLTHPDSAALL